MSREPEGVRSLDEIRELEAAVVEAKAAYRKKTNDENRTAHREASQALADARSELRVQGFYTNPMTDEELQGLANPRPDSVSGKARRG